MTGSPQSKNDNQSLTSKDIAGPAGAEPDGRSAGGWSAIVEDPQKAQPWLARLAAVPALGLVVVAIYGVAVHDAAVVAVGIIVAGAAFMVGALLGFLFG